MIGMSPAGMALGGLGIGGLGGAGDLLRGQVKDETDEEKKRREREARLGNYSAAGRALFDFGQVGVPGAM
jgi:hypothetical protein